MEFEEAIRHKRGILSSEMNVLSIAKAIGRYSALREEELKLKSVLSRRLRLFSSELKKIQISLPNPPTPRRFLGADKKEMTKIETPRKKDLELELNDIRERLRAIGG